LAGIDLEGASIGHDPHPPSILQKKKKKKKEGKNTNYEVKNTNLAYWPLPINIFG
jgi:hypothetical protein